MKGYKEAVDACGMFTLDPHSLGVQAGRVRIALARAPAQRIMQGGYSASLWYNMLKEEQRRKGAEAQMEIRTPLLPSVLFSGRHSAIPITNGVDTVPHL